jgi:hypothetical protein
MTPSARTTIAVFSGIERVLIEPHHQEPTVPIDGRPRFVKRSMSDGQKVKIAAIDPDFA